MSNRKASASLPPLPSPPLSSPPTNDAFSLVQGGIAANVFGGAEDVVSMLGDTGSEIIGGLGDVAGGAADMLGLGAAS